LPPVVARGGQTFSQVQKIDADTAPVSKAAFVRLGLRLALGERLMTGIWGGLRVSADDILAYFVVRDSDRLSGEEVFGIYDECTLRQFDVLTYRIARLVTLKVDRYGLNSYTAMCGA
jgi:hypothetical protein